jgi:hypothetical protein
VVEMPGKLVDFINPFHHSPKAKGAKDTKPVSE